MHYDDGYIFDDADVDNVPVFSESRRFSLLDSHEKMLLRDYIRSCIREHREFSGRFPTEDELVEIAGEAAECAKIFGVDPRVAFLSYSTLGSGKGEDVDKMRNAANKTREKYPELPIEGELQFDAAVSPRVARTKCPESKVAGHANTFIFPDINAGNIGYKIAQRLGNFDAYGPILLGLNAPINDLSRGCNASEVYSMAIITAALA